MTGKESLYTEFNGKWVVSRKWLHRTVAMVYVIHLVLLPVCREIMFHVSTFLPYEPNDWQQVSDIGNLTKSMNGYLSCWEWWLDFMMRLWIITIWLVYIGTGMFPLLQSHLKQCWCPSLKHYIYSYMYCMMSGSQLHVQNMQGYRLGTFQLWRPSSPRLTKGLRGHESIPLLHILLI